MRTSIDASYWCRAPARVALSLRGHWLRMPPRLLLPHLARKSVMRLRARGGARG